MYTSYRGQISNIIIGVFVFKYSKRDVNYLNFEKKKKKSCVTLLLLFQISLYIQQLYLFLKKIRFLNLILIFCEICHFNFQIVNHRNLSKKLIL